jgi:replicase family protein
VDIAEDPFYQSLPRRPWCADYGSGHRVSSEMRDRAAAILLPYIQINAPGIYRHIAVGAGDPFSWEDALLPQPSLTVIAKNRGAAQFIWTLESPVTTSPKGRKGPQEYAFKVGRAIAERIDGDDIVPHDRRALAMNPFYPAFDSIRHNSTFSLDQLGEAVLENLLQPRQRFAQLRRVPNREREKALFEVVRAHACQRVRLFQSEAAFAEYLVNFAGVANLSFQRPLDAHVIIKKAGAVAAWTWEHRIEIDGGRNRGAANLPSIPSFVTREERARLRTEHKQAGARYSARMKVRSAARKIKGAIMRPTLDDVPHDLSISKLSNETGLDRKTARRHIQALQALHPLLKPASPKTTSILIVRTHPSPSTVSVYPPISPPRSYVLKLVPKEKD